MKIFNEVKNKILISAALTIFLTVGVAFAQFDAGGTGFDPTQLVGTEGKDLLNAPTGKMTDEIDLEIVARIAVCHKGGAISEEEFNILKSPYDITALEFTAYYVQRLRGGEGTNQFLEKWASRMPGLVAAVKAKGCKFGIKPEPTAPEKCNGYCSTGNVCPANTINKGLANCQPQKQCRSCGFLGLRKCCESLPTVCCEYPKPVTDCSAGMCTYEDCPEGTQDVGVTNCGEEDDCRTCWWGFAKCCEKRQTKCCMTPNYAKCTEGTCENSDVCPRGFKKMGTANCGFYEKVHSCGFLGLAKCADPVLRTCCVPE